MKTDTESLPKRDICHLEPPQHKPATEVNMTKRRVVTRVHPGSSHFKSLQKNHRRLKQSLVMPNRLLLKSEIKVYEKTKQNNLI